MTRRWRSHSTQEALDAVVKNDWAKRGFCLARGRRARAKALVQRGWGVGRSRLRGQLFRVLRALLRTPGRGAQIPVFAPGRRHRRVRRGDGLRGDERIRRHGQRI